MPCLSTPTLATSSLTWLELGASLEAQAAIIANIMHAAGKNAVDFILNSWGGCPYRLPAPVHENRARPGIAPASPAGSPRCARCPRSETAHGRPREFPESRRP